MDVLVGGKPILLAIVTRVRPGTSKGITDLLLPHFRDLVGPGLPKKELALVGGSWQSIPNSPAPAPLRLAASGNESEGAGHPPGYAPLVKDWGLARYRNRPDRSLHELRTAMHHHLHHWERSCNLSFMNVSCTGELARVESN